VLDEASRDDVARELGVTPSTFDVVLHRAMQALRKALGAHDDKQAARHDDVPPSSEAPDA